MKKKIGELYDVETKSRDKKMNVRRKYKEKEQTCNERENKNGKI